MKPMTGEIGRLILDGEQIGGFKYWTTVMRKNPLSTHVIASQYWFFEKPEINKLMAEFYNDIGETLELVDKREVTLKIPDCELDKKIVSKLDMNLGAYEWIDVK